MSDLHDDAVPRLTERTVPGLHDAVIAHIGHRLHPGLRAVDLGTGSGAFAERLASFGCDVVACDADPTAYRGTAPFVNIDCDEPFSAILGAAAFDVVSAVEVVEHLAAPIHFLQEVRSLLRPGGFALVTTPNVDSLPARAKFLLKDKIRMFDEHGDPTHTSPIFWDLLLRMYLPRAGLRLMEHTLYPRGGFVSGRPAYTKMLAAVSPLIQRGLLAGDNHILVLSRMPEDPPARGEKAMGDTPP